MNPNLQFGDVVKLSESRTAVGIVYNAPDAIGSFTIQERDTGRLIRVPSVIAGVDGFTRTWELIERPKPEAKLGSVWVDPVTDTRWVALGSGWYSRAVDVSLHGSRTITPNADENQVIIARLVPAEDQG